MNTIYELNKYFCKLLKINEIPVVEISSNEMCQLAGDETLACYHNLEKRIYIISKEEYTLEDFYMLAHELRHAWQHVKDPNYYFGDYDSEMSIHEYHTSVAEIDANAFAYRNVCKYGYQALNDFRKSRKW